MLPKIKHFSAKTAQLELSTAERLLVQHTP